MAAVQERNNSFRILFRYLGRQYTFTLGEVARDEAEIRLPRSIIFFCASSRAWSIFRPVSPSRSSSRRTGPRNFFWE